MTRAQAILEPFSNQAKIVGAEVGVFAGVLSSSLLSAHKGLILIMIDAWRSLPHKADLLYSKFGPKDWERTMSEALKNTFFAQSRRIIMPLTSAEAAGLIKDASLDFVYIDGNHQFEYVSEDIKAWLPKVKKGGRLCGHDYTFAQNHWGVKKAVDEILGNVEVRKDIDSWFFIV